MLETYPFSSDHMQLVKCILMETATNATQTPRELPVVGGHLALDFANTVDDPEGPKRYDHADTLPGACRVVGSHRRFDA